MNSYILKALGLIGLGAIAAWTAAGGFRTAPPIERRSPPVSQGPPQEESDDARAAREPARPAEADQGVGAVETSPAEADQRIGALEARLMEQSALTSQLEARIGELAAEVAGLRRDRPPGDEAAGDGEGPTAQAAPRAAPARPRESIDYSKSAMQRALEAAGLDEDTAESIKLRGDQLAMTEMYLRDQATREGWLDSPRFREEIEAINEQRTSIRDELGDEGYDRYLFSLGRTNRVIVQDVMFESVAESVGLETGDLIISYGDTRIFEPDELVAQTRQGAIGDNITLEVVRNRERLEIEVPRGPLGLRIGPTQDDPDA